MPRKLSILNYLKIYFSTAPFIFGELFLIFGFTALSNADQRTENIVIGILFLLVGLYFTYRKVKVLRRAIITIKNGKKVIANLSFILNSNIIHNSRVVKNYFFNYKIDDKIYTYDYSSAYKRHLKTGDIMELYYLPSNPEFSFIPELYNVELK
ncbi:MAG: hypothetical protein DSY77_09730 [Bacteroidetes bacterium]|nr:MAG: hypothetical protein DSY77_09730 [Bacteroidota bacterium]